MILLRKMINNDDKRNIYSLYKKAFPKCEQKSFKLMLKLQDTGLYSLNCIEDDDGIFYGLAITVETDKYILLDYLAIQDNFQNQKLGTKALAILKDKCEKSNKILVIEHEDSMANNAKNILQRVRRKNFYLKNSMTTQPYKVNLSGNDMEVVTYNGNISFDEYIKIYYKIYGEKKAIKKVKLI